MTSIGFLHNTEHEGQLSAPSAPATGNWRLYFKSDGLYVMDDDGAEHGPLWAGVYKESGYNLRMGGIVWMRIADDNTNRIFSVSADGQNWLTMHSVGRTDYITADEVGFLIGMNGSGSAVGMTLLSWKEA